MNDERRDEFEDEVEAEVTHSLQDDADKFEGDQEATPAPVAMSDTALRALALTVRTAMRNGHPDAQKHLDTLLSALGAQ